MTDNNWVELLKQHIDKHAVEPSKWNPDRRSMNVSVLVNQKWEDMTEEFKQSVLDEIEEWLQNEEQNRE